MNVNVDREEVISYIYIYTPKLIVLSSTKNLHKQYIFYPINTLPASHQTTAVYDYEVASAKMSSSPLSAQTPFCLLTLTEVVVHAH